MAEGLHQYGAARPGDAASAPIEEAAASYPGWRVVMVCFAVALFAWGLGFYGHGVYLAELRRLHGWPAAVISGASSAYYLLSAVLVVFVSDAMRRLGPRRLMLVGIACLGASTALVPAVAAVWQLYAVYALMSFGWATTSVAAITNILGLWFERRRGMAISLALTGASAGGIVIAPALVAATGHVGFGPALTGVALIMAAVLVPAILAMPERPTPPAPRGRDGADQPASAMPAAAIRREALRSARFWTIAAPFALALLAQVGFLVHQIAFLEPMLGRTPAGLAVAVTTGTAVVGRAGLGMVIDRLDPRLMSAAAFASQAAALFVMTRATDAPILFAACALLGFSVGNVITLPALIIQREFAPASFGVLIALSTAICQCTYAFGPGLIGLLRDATGSYAAPLAASGTINVVATALVLLHRSRGAGRR